MASLVILYMLNEGMYKCTELDSEYLYYTSRACFFSPALLQDSMLRRFATLGARNSGSVKTSRWPLRERGHMP
jgi:hypothetical protein